MEFREIYSEARKYLPKHITYKGSKYSIKMKMFRVAML